MLHCAVLPRREEDQMSTRPMPSAETFTRQYLIFAALLLDVLATAMFISIGVGNFGQLTIPAGLVANLFGYLMLVRELKR